MESSNQPGNTKDQGHSNQAGNPEQERSRTGSEHADTQQHKSGAQDHGDNGDQPVQTEESDKRSVFVKNVEYKATKDEIEEFFKSCGKINRVTIVTDRITRHPKGCCYIEFNDPESVESAITLTDSVFKGRTIQVMPKRTNLPQKSPKPIGPIRGGRGGFPMRGRGFIPRGGGFIAGGMGPRGRGGYHPYR